MATRQYTSAAPFLLALTWFALMTLIFLLFVMGFKKRRGHHERHHGRHQHLYHGGYAIYGHPECERDHPNVITGIKGMPAWDMERAIQIPVGRSCSHINTIPMVGVGRIREGYYR
jgi:hypothetical protein